MADKSKGWVLLYRSIRDSWIWDKKPFSHGQAWIDLILDVNHDTGKFYLNGKLKEIGRGQKWTSVRTLAARWGWRNEDVINFLRALEDDGMITRETTQSGTLLTLINYGDFQDARNTKRNGQRNDKRNGQRNETKKDRERMTKEGKKERDLPSEGKTESDINTDSSWFDSLEDENDTAEH